MGKETTNPSSYAGPEQREFVRRSGIDRRTMLRWEPSKDNRRQGTGRREDDQVWDAIRSK
ncbi:MAG: hypothetical protein OES46_17820 [Gammaproteobacteria bacterium]|jgi:hypothetical protein|nr:hypothetical protein [Gammaproteobacteria bacterium]